MNPLPHLLNQKIAELGQFESQLDFVQSELSSRYLSNGGFEIAQIIAHINDARLNLIKYQYQILKEGLKNATQERLIQENNQLKH